MELMQEDAPLIERTQLTEGQDVYLVQASGACTVPAPALGCSSMDCLTAGPYVALDVSLEELEHPAVCKVKYLH
jgi:hypothetical protein